MLSGNYAWDVAGQNAVPAAAERDIRSAVLFGTSEYKGFQVDGLGISFTPIPEPSTLSLIALGIVGRQLGD